jgi:tellurite methyltransferase
MADDDKRRAERGAIWPSYYEKLRDRPPRRTTLLALDRLGPEPRGRLAVDLGCGDGRDAIEMLRRGWRVMAVDAEAVALERLKGRLDLPEDAEIDAVVSRFEKVDLPRDALLVNSSFALPLCEPEDFRRIVSDISHRLAPGGRFAAQFYGPRDSWVGRAGITFVSRAEAERLLEGLDVELFEEEESDGVTPRGNTKHWHIFHIVARKAARSPATATHGPSVAV